LVKNPNFEQNRNFEQSRNFEQNRNLGQKLKKISTLHPGWLLILLKKLRDDQIIKVEEIGTSNDEMHVPPKELTTARKLKTRNTNIDFASKSTAKKSKNTVVQRAISKTLVTRSVVTRDPKSTECVEGKTQALEHKQKIINPKK